MFDQGNESISECYEAARAVHGDLGVSLVRFRERIEAIVARCLPSTGTGTGSGSFLSALHTSDLYLACACADSLDAGWQRFYILYRRYLMDLGRCLTGGNSDNEEIGQTVWIDLFLPDRSGNSRIGSYDGRSSMATWLRVVVTNRVINERQRSDHRTGDLDSIPEPADPSALRRVEDRLGHDRYQSMIIHTFKHAFSTLSKRERIILLLRYDHGVQLGDIAELLQVHQSTITRQIDRAVARLREDVMSLLGSQYQLGQPAIEECLGVARETFTSSVSILSLIERRAADAAKQLYPFVRGRSDP